MRVLQILQRQLPLLGFGEGAQNSRVDVANDGGSPDVDTRSILDPSGSVGEAPVSVEALEGRDDHSSSSAGDGRNGDHGPRGGAKGGVGVLEDRVDTKGGDADDAGEAVDEAEAQLARVVGEREKGRDDARLGGEERQDTVERWMLAVCM